MDGRTDGRMDWSVDRINYGRTFYRLKIKTIVNIRDGIFDLI